MRSRTIRVMGAGVTTALLAGGAVLAGVGTASAAPTSSTATETAREHCRTVTGHWVTVDHDGHKQRFWVSEHQVCWRR